MAVNQEYIAPDQKNKKILPISGIDESKDAKPFMLNNTQMEKVAQSMAKKIKRKNAND